LHEEREDVGDDEDGGDPTATNDAEPRLLRTQQYEPTEHHVQRGGVEGGGNENANFGDGCLGEICTVVEGQVLCVVADRHDCTVLDSVGVTSDERRCETYGDHRG
jgi:hypothetical protein